MPIALSVNLNKVALLRNSRTDNNPDVETFAEISIDAGTAGLTAHPRPDQRHIRPNDISSLSAIAVKRGVEFNIEGNPFAGEQGDYLGLIPLVERVLPQQCTLVPDSDSQLTSDHGFDLDKSYVALMPVIAKLRKLNVRISLFLDPVTEQIQQAHELGADRIELYTGPYAAAFAQSEREGAKVFEQHVKAAEYANTLGLEINAGHDLNLSNLPLYSQLPGLKEVSIGHALTADALKMGFANAVQAYNEICKG